MEIGIGNSLITKGHGGDLLAATEGDGTGFIIRLPLKNEAKRVAVLSSSK